MSTKNNKAQKTEAPKANDKMAAMLAAAQQNEQAAAEAPKAAGQRNKVTHTKVASTPSVDENGNRRQKRNTNMTERKVAVFVSDELKLAWLGTHIGFSTKTEAGMIGVVKNAPQKALSPLQAAGDLRLAELTELIAQGPELEQAKADLFDKYKNDGFTMLSRRAKVAAPVEAPAAEAPASEEQAEEAAE